MGRGKRPTTSEPIAAIGRHQEQHDNDPPTEYVCVELWVTPSVVDVEGVDVRVRASGYDQWLRNDYALDEAESETLGEPLTLELLRRLLTAELAEAVAGELNVAYREPRHFT